MSNFDLIIFLAGVRCIMGVQCSIPVSRASTQMYLRAPLHNSNLTGNELEVDEPASAAVNPLHAVACCTEDGRELSPHPSSVAPTCLLYFVDKPPLLKLQWKSLVQFGMITHLLCKVATNFGFNKNLGSFDKIILLPFFHLWHGKVPCKCMKSH